ncbi:MAG: site-specific integrase, partial [Acidobacteria bacterium]
VATLLLQANVPQHVVSQRLGHAQVGTTMDIYAHVLPTQQADATERLGALLHG